MRTLQDMQNNGQGVGMNDEAKNAAVVRQEFGASQMVAPVETQSMAMASQAKALVESRYVMAMQRPRNWDQVRQDVLKECKRPAFARNTSTYYHKPIGKGVEGLGIRFVEVALRCMTNMLVESSLIFEDADKEVHRVSVTDLESNVTYPLDVRCSKSVERSRPMGDGTFISVRNNSYGKPVYTVVATDDELLNKRAALISKAVRTVGLRLVPGDIQDEAEEIIKAIRQDAAAKDPAAERKALADGFGQMGVKAAELAEYLGHALDACSPAELSSLRALWGAIRNGEASWGDAIRNARDQREEEQSQRNVVKPAPAAEQAQDKGEEDEWPKPFDNAGVIGWTDKDGSVYDPNLHGWSAQNAKPAVRADGVFRARRHVRGKGKTAPELTPGELEAKQATDEDAALKRAQAEAAGSVPPQGVDQRPTDGGFGELE